MGRDGMLLSRVAVSSTRATTGQPTAIPYHLKIPPNHESAVNTMALDDAQQQPRSADANGGHQDPADHDEHGLLVTLRGRAAVELNDSRWRESIVHLLDDEGV
jgi:hypothetical protein